MATPKLECEAKPLSSSKAYKANNVFFFFGPTANCTLNDSDCVFGKLTTLLIMNLGCENPKNLLRKILNPQLLIFVL